jgi:hypothetical protein
LVRSPGQLVEGSQDPQVYRFLGPEFVVAAAEVLHKGVASADHPCAAESFQAAHRPQPGLQLAMIGFDPVVGVGLGVVPGARSQLIEDGRVDRCLVGDDLGRGRPVLECVGEESVGGP